MIPLSAQLGMDNELAREVETLRKKLQDWKQVLIRMEGYIHDKQSAWGTDPDDIVMLKRIAIALGDTVQPEAKQLTDA